MGKTIHLNFFILAITVYVFYALTGFVYGDMMLGSPLLNYLFTVVPFMLLFADILLNKRLIITNEAILWVFFISYILARSMVYEISLYELQIILFLTFIFFVNDKTDKYKTLIKIIEIFAVVYAFGCIFQFAFSNQYMQYIYPLFSTGGRDYVSRLFREGLYSGFTHQTDWAANYITFGIGIICCKWIVRYKIRATEIICLLGMFFAVLLTGKREHILYIPLIITMVCLIFSLNKNKAKVIFKIFLIIAIIALIIIIAYPMLSQTSGLGRTLISISDLTKGKDISDGRFALYQRALVLFKDHPLFGIGFGNFKKISGYTTDVHNVYLQLLCETGIIGIILFIVPVFYTYFILLKIIKRFKAVASDKYTAFCLSYAFFQQTFFILAGIVENTIYNIETLLIYLFSCLMAYSLELKLKKIQEENHDKKIISEMFIP